MKNRKLSPLIFCLSSLGFMYTSVLSINPKNDTYKTNKIQLQLRLTQIEKQEKKLLQLKQQLKLLKQQLELKPEQQELQEIQKQLKQITQKQERILQEQQLERQKEKKLS